MTRPSPRCRALIALVLAVALAPAARAGVKFDEHGKQLDPNATNAALDTDQDVRPLLGKLEPKALVDIQETLQALRGQLGYTEKDARALSAVTEALDRSDGLDEKKEVEGEKQERLGPIGFADLPRKYWWCMFIDVRSWKDGPLVFDYQESPGYYAAMTRAFRDVLAGDSQLLTVESYAAMHGLVIDGTFHLVTGVYSPIRTEWNEDGKNVAFGIADLGRGDLLDDDAFAELKTERLAELVGDLDKGLPPQTAKILERGRPKGNPSSEVTYTYEPGSNKIIAGTKYGPDAAKGRVRGLILRYHRRITEIREATEMADETARRERVKAICKLVRGLHVSHVFADANGRLNTMLLLNRLLIDQGLSPSIVEDTSIFGGRSTLATLISEVLRGQQRFAEAVAAAHEGKACHR